MCTVATSRRLISTCNLLSRRCCTSLLSGANKARDVVPIAAAAGGTGPGPRFTGMELVLLGTASASPAVTRGVSSTALRLGGEIWLFDCGEGSQRQMLGTGVRPKRISRVFITHLHGDHLYGLQGLLLNMKVAGLQNGGQEPRRTVHVYGPEGLFNYICATLSLSEALLDNLSVVVHELVTLPELDSQSAPTTPTSTAVELSTSRSKKRNKKRKKKRRPHGGYFPLMSVNGVRKERLYPNLRGEWVLFDDRSGDDCANGGGFAVRALAIEHRVQTVGYVVEEGGLRGQIDRERTTALGLPPGPLYSQLKTGKSVELECGRVITPEEVVSPPVRGRKVVILGDTCDPYSMVDAAHGADVLLHESTLANEDHCLAAKRGHSTAGMAGDFAAAVDAKLLILTHFSNRFSACGNVGRVWTGDSAIKAAESRGRHPDNSFGVLDLVAQAQQAGSTAGRQQAVLAGHDHVVVHIPRGGFDHSDPESISAATTSSLLSSSDSFSAALMRRLKRAFDGGRNATAAAAEISDVLDRHSL